MNRGLDLAISDWMHQASKFAKLKASRASVSKVLTNKQQRDYDSWLAQALVKLVYNKTTKEHVPQPGRLSKRHLMNHCCLLELERAVEVSNCRARTLNLSFNLCLFDRSDHPACPGFFVRPPFEESCEAFQNPHICTYISNLAAYIGMYICMYMQTVPPLALPPFVYIRENMKCLLKPWFEAPSQELRLSA